VRALKVIGSWLVVAFFGASMLYCAIRAYRGMASDDPSMHSQAVVFGPLALVSMFLFLLSFALPVLLMGKGKKGA
jgi:hypothetical protein